MALGETWMELAKLRAADLRAEGRRVGLDRRTAPAARDRGATALQVRAGQLVHWLQHGQIGTGVDDRSEAPLTARGRCA
jgi:hypothetical protein